MSFLTYPLNYIDYDYEAAETWLSTRSSGVFVKNDFDYTVTNADTIITFGEGLAWIHNHRFAGKVFRNDENFALDFGVSDNVYDRIDVAAIQFDKVKNTTQIIAKHGVAQTNPVIPAIVQTEELYELYICSVSRKAGSAYITYEDIKDLRLSPQYCGLMADSVTEIDTTGINAQINALIEELREEIANIKTDTNTMLKSVYDTDNDNIVDFANDAQMLDGYKSNHFATKGETEHTADGLLTTAVLKNGIAKLRVIGKSVQNGIPAVDNPAEITSVGEDGTTELTVAGKNLLKYPYSEGTKSTEGMNFIANADGSVTCDGSTTGVAYFNVREDVNGERLFVKKGKYIVSRNGNKNIKVSFAFTKKTGERIFVDVLENDIFSKTVELEEDCEMFSFLRIDANVTLDNETVYPMLRLATETDDTYEPYKGNDYTLPITLNGIPVDEGGNYTDESGQQWIADTAEIENGVVTVTRNVRKVVFDGTEFWEHASWMPITQIFQRTCIPADDNVSCICSHFKGQEGKVGGSVLDNSIAFNKNGYVYVRLDENSEIATADKFKDWLAQTPVTSVYALATPTTETYTIDQIVNEAGTVNIIQPDGAGLVATLSGAASAEAVEQIKTILGDQVVFTLEGTKLIITRKQ